MISHLSPLRTIVIWLCLPLIPFTMGCEEEQVEEPVVARPVKMMTVSLGGKEGVHEFPGRVKARLTYPMAFEVAGRIIGFAVKEGQPVKKGQILARLDPRDYQAQLDAEIAKQNAARAEYDRKQALFEVDAISRQDLDVARRNFEVAKSNVRIAKKAFNDTYLRATFSGKIGKKIASDFKEVQAKETVLILQDESSLELVINVPEGDWVRSDPNMTNEERTKKADPHVVVSAAPDRRFPATIKEWSTTADPDTRTFEVKLAFDPPSDLKILPGMTGKAIATPPKLLTRFAIPAKAVLGDENGASFVWLVDQSSMTVKRTPVKAGNMSGNMVSIESGLSEGDVIVTSGVHQLREGMEVRRFVTPGE